MSPPTTTTTTTNDHSTIERSRRNRNRSKKNGININNVSNGHIYTDFNPIEFIEQHGHIRWPKNEFCTPCNCMCFFIAFIFLVTALMSGIYYNLNFFDGKHLRERVFKAKFVVRNQDFLLNELENVDSNEFRQFSNMLRKRIDSLFQQSMISGSFVKTEIIAFERKRNSPSETIIHLNVHVASDKSSNVETSDIYLILAEEIINNRLKIFDNLMVDHNSIDVQERRWHPFHRIGGSNIVGVGGGGGGGAEKYSMDLSASVSGNPWHHKSMFPGMLEGLQMEPTPPPRKCGRINLQYCRFLPYNQTSYPNFFHHWNLSSIEEEFIQFKELIDSECYSLSKQFLCNLLQPECQNNNEDIIILPCRNFCQEFFDSCHRWLPEKLMKKISCSTFPAAAVVVDDDEERQNDFGIWNQQRRQRRKICHNKPDCATQLRLQSQHYKICDGIFDCLDETDESNCTYCSISNGGGGGGSSTAHFHCGDRQCILLNQTCDNIRDCRNGADEINCLRLMVMVPPKLSHTTTTTTTTTTTRTKLIKMTTLSIMNEGYLDAISRGKHSLVCNDHSSTYNSNQTQNNNGANGGYYNYDNHTPILGHNICEENYFEADISLPVLFQMHHQLVSRDSFQEQHYHHRYWPWYAKININGHYYCDGTLITLDTIIAQTTCFNVGQIDPKSMMANNNNITVILGSVRLSKDNIESNEFRVGSIKQQIIDDPKRKQQQQQQQRQRLTLLKLEQRIQTDKLNLIRPICSPKQSTTTTTTTSTSSWTSSHKCVIVNLNYEQDMLNHRPVKIINVEQCRRHLTIPSFNHNINNHYQQWNLLAFEYYTIQSSSMLSEQRTNEYENLILFQIIPIRIV
ncbi:atrial natriuretic peptide-converting enzyme-like protein [Dermatophagoides farinae]|uniref:Atrial natriuretic peptide-converting enzyme-like protein n=1 Tax=Dermatophagoides farinae TaxID=6954 RepID=A0A9D4SDB5_DERFA|nr:atrial natriuretic peptide-converting enzyme-like protein [Dermatophagoides farinae]